jgi:8-oxo-dGTP diphosphatase
VREVFEETGVECVCGELLGWVERFGDDHHFVILDFLATPLSVGEPVAGDDAAEARWVPLTDVDQLDLVPGLAEFLHEHEIIELIT